MFKGSMVLLEYTLKPPLIMRLPTLKDSYIKTKYYPKVQLFKQTPVGKLIMMQ